MFLAVFYCFIAWAIAQAFNVPELAATISKDPAALIYIIGDYYVGPWAGIVAQILLLCDRILQRRQPLRTLDGIERDPAQSAMRVHHRFRSPSFGNVQWIITGVVVLVFGLLGPGPLPAAGAGGAATRPAE